MVLIILSLSGIAMLLFDVLTLSRGLIISLIIELFVR